MELELVLKRVLWTILMEKAPEFTPDERGKFTDLLDRGFVDSEILGSDHCPMVLDLKL